MAVVENRFICDLSKPVQAQALKGNVFSLDNLGSRLSVLIYDNGHPATISGSITANCILPDGSTVNVNGGLTTENGGSKAYVDVPQSCLLIPGLLKIAIKCTSSSVITTLAAIVANVYMTKTDNVITPSQQIINDWNAEISAAIATQNAAIATQDGKIADLKSELKFYVNGKEVSDSFIQGRRPSYDLNVVISDNTKCTSQKVFVLTKGDTLAVTGIYTGIKYAVISSIPYDSGWKTSAFTYTATADCLAIINVAASNGTDTLSPGSINLTMTHTDMSSQIKKANDDVYALDIKTHNEIWSQKIEKQLHRGWFIYGYRINTTSNVNYQANAKSIVALPIYLTENTIFRVSGDYTMRIVTRPTASISTFNEVVANEVSNTDVYVKGCQFVSISITYTGNDDNPPMAANEALTIICGYEQAQYLDSYIVDLRNDIDIDTLYNYLDKMFVTKFTVSSETGYLLNTSDYSYSTVNQFRNKEKISLVWGATISRTAYIQYSDNTIVTVNPNVAVEIPAGSVWRLLIPSIFSSAGGLIGQLGRMTMFHLQHTTDANIVKQAVDFKMVRNWVTSSRIFTKPTGFTTGAMQDCDKYGKYMVMTRANVWMIYVVDMDTNTVVGSGTFTEANFGHANGVCFTNQFLNDGDTFPLLLISNYSTVHDEHVVHVYHIANDFTITYKSSFTVASEFTGDSEFIYDRESNNLCGIGYTSGGYGITRYTIPYNNNWLDITTIGSDAIADSFVYPIDGNTRWFQGACLIGNLLYVVTNNSSLVDTKLFVFNLFEKRCVNIIDSGLQSDLVNAEANGCFVNYKEDGEYGICIVDNGGNGFGVEELKRNYVFRESV